MSVRGNDLLTYDGAFDVTTPAATVRAASSLMLTTPPRPDWDIFCAVIDNLGDIGVCWRLSRQLVAEYGVRVRLWVDELAAFAQLCPQLDPALPLQQLRGVEIRRWEKPFAALRPARIVLESFACQLPESFVAAMAEQTPRPVWINLDYLSAEDWVPHWHGLPSPHPRLPLVKYFFFPGFGAATGGLLREHELAAQRQSFLASPAQQREFWCAAAGTEPPGQALLISLFAYDNPVLPALLDAWEASPQPICCLVPLSRTLPLLAAWCGQALAAGQRVRRGALEIRILPFLEQNRYDQLLWLSDLNFVRGEDSFVRAQWARQPFVWHIYPQPEAAHRPKLAAFLNRYCADLPAPPAAALRAFWQLWNGEGAHHCAPEEDGADASAGCRSAWRELVAQLEALRAHARGWEEGLAQDDDLCRRLVRFAGSQL